MPSLNNAHLTWNECTFNLTVNKPIIITHASSAGPIHIYSKVLLNFHTSHGTVPLEFTIE